jgi:NADPH-dependent 2,4-dienoyl-CoA reductase/sulfur reductase-like enzyme/rhodanese-related sulfurtransferase
MSEQKRIVVIGGTACGPKAAARARRCDPTAKITIIEQKENLSTATCGLPYYISGVIAKESALVTRQPDYFRDVFNMTVLTGTRALSIDAKAHAIEIADLKTNQHSPIFYDKLILATGALPTVPPWEGKDLKGIFTLSNIPDANAIRAYLAGLDKKEVVIVGAGLIGMEMAENFVAAGCKVTIIEALGWPLPTLLDADIAAHLEKHLISKGVKLLFGQRVSGFSGDRAGKVRKVLAGDIAYEAGLVLLSLGVKPNVALAKEAGLTIGTTGGLAVNQYLQTSDPDIYAGGDCAETVNLITGKKTLVPLGSTANKQGRVIGNNVTGGNDTFPGIVGTGIAKIFDFNVGRTGLNEAQALAAGYEITSTVVPTFDHATYYPGSKDILLKLIAEKSTGKLLGGQAVGTGDTSKRIDVLATALTFGAKVSELANLDLGYAPPYNSAMDPLHNAANVIRNKQDGHTRSLTPAEVKKKIESGEDFILLDVRSAAEWQAQRIEAKQVRLIPLPELRRRIDELPRDKEIVTLCRTSIRAYQAQRILDGAGFKNVKIMDGSMTAWTYDTVSGLSGKK